jgi:hypothetical protein
MRSVQVSADVFQAIWSARRAGEDDEDAILRRLLRVGNADLSPTQVTENAGWVDARSGTRFPDGFEMYRRYLGREYRARVVNGHWHLNDRKLNVSSMNDLSRAVGTKVENGWVNWKYRTNTGEERRISDLRPPGSVRTHA